MRSVARGCGLFTACFGCLLLLGCGWQQTEQLLWPERTQSHTQMTENWTRQGRIFSGLQTRVRIRATYKSLQWRESFVRRWDEVYGLSPKDAAAMRQAQHKQYRQGASFVVALSSSDPKYARLDWSEGLWRLQLLYSGRRVDPVDIRNLDWPKPKLETFFPYTKPWLQFYEVQFPVFIEDEPMQLLFGGPGGPIELQWDLVSLP